MSSVERALRTGKFFSAWIDRVKISARPASSADAKAVRAMLIERIGS